MLSAAHRAPKYSRSFLAAAGLALAAGLGGCIGGCNSQKSSQERFDDAAKDLPNFKRQNVAKFAGKVVVDGQPLESKAGKKLFIVLNDAAKLDETSKARYAMVNPDGSFDFMTYLEHDGVPVGKYVVTFVAFGPLKAMGRGLTSGGGSAAQMYGGGDGLKNLYSDPDKNAKDDKFVINVEQPGKTDYEFDLTLAGKEPAQPGPRAVKRLAGI